MARVRATVRAMTMIAVGLAAMVTVRARPRGAGLELVGAASLTN